MDNSPKNMQNIVTMTQFQTHSSFASIAVIEAYWEALRAGREMPKRAEIDPRGIESALAHAFILERVAPGVARMRIAGSHLNDVMGMEARGMPLTSFFERDARQRIATLLEEVFQTPATAQVMMKSDGSLGQPALEARMLLLPLKSDLGDVSRILGCFVSLGEVGAAPRRFDLCDIKLQSLRTHPALNPPDRGLHAGFEERRRPYDPVEADAGAEVRPPYLRLVK